MSFSERTPPDINILPTYEADKPHHECGIIGIYAPGEDVSQLTYFGLYPLQHRGQESAGIAVSGGAKINVRKRMGLVTALTQKDINSLKGTAAIGHTRYSNTGGSNLVNAQPALYQDETTKEYIAIAENGNLINPRILREKLAARGYNPSFAENERCSSDGELIAQLIHASSGRNWIEKIQNASLNLHGAYSLTILAGDSLIGVKDPLGFWPLCLGRLNGQGYVLASESAALDTIGAEFIRELDPGEVLLINEFGLERHFLPNAQAGKSARCAFDLNYFLRPDSRLSTGEQAYEIRERLGELLVTKHPVEADIVIQVPDSGEHGAIGYARQSGIPYVKGLVKNKYIGRTFIEPDQRIREMGVKLKLNPLRRVIDGRRIIVVDDSIVRGTTSREITRLLRYSGAKEVHWRLTFPQVIDSCSFGIDMVSKDELISAYKTPQRVAKYLGADSVAFNSVEDFIQATRMPPERLCTGCVTGKYPIDVPSLERDKFSLGV